MDGVSRFKEFTLNHGSQLKSSGVPEYLWHTLSRKLESQTFDAGDAFQMLLLDYGEDDREPEDPIYTVVAAKGIKKMSEIEIYIIDHAWTYRLNTARRQLRQIPELLNRMKNMMGGSHLDDTEEAIDFVMESMWRYNQMYIMDEFGSAINHSDTPNCRIVPFMHFPDGFTYSLLFPIKDIEEGTQIPRDYVEGSVQDPQIRNALLLPWRKTQFTDIDFQQTEPDESYFLDGHIEESLPVAAALAPQIDRSRVLKVFTTYSVLKQHLNDPLFEIVENEDDADILWLTTHFKTYKEFSESAPNKFINQFPFENVITIKDLLAIVCRRTANKYHDDDTLETWPKWMPTTFNLKTELIKFVSYYQSRNEKQLDNHWIIKPWNLARGLDTYISKNLSQIVRLHPTGPKIAQKYLDKPVLFTRADNNARVKFDVRYVLLLKNTEPLEAYVYRNYFLRFANKPFGLDSFDVYEKHFTVMNYGDDLQLLHLPCAEFVKLWNEQYPKHDWENIEKDICEMLHETLIGATQKQPPCGIGKSPQSKALYAADIMLEWTDCHENQIQPKLLEINFLPDCKRACDYYPQFYNDIFKLLFLDIPNDKMFRDLKM